MNGPLFINGQYNGRSKNVIITRKCDFCAKEYIGWGRKYCSNKCARKDQPKGPDSPFWKGDLAKENTGRGRALKLYPARPCEICGDKKSDRHHKSGNTLDNSKKNIQYLCRKHHFMVDQRIYKIVKTRGINALVTGNPS